MLYGVNRRIKRRFLRVFSLRTVKLPTCLSHFLLHRRILHVYYVPRTTEIATERNALITVSKVKTNNCSFPYSFCKRRDKFNHSDIEKTAVSIAGSQTILPEGQKLSPFNLQIQTDTLVCFLFPHYHRDFKLCLTAGRTNKTYFSN